MRKIEIRRIDDCIKFFEDGKEITDRDFGFADLRLANLRGANLKEANLQGANLKEANLQGANLQRADIRVANLQGANLDYSCWPLWCGSIGVILDDKLKAQILYHALINAPELATKKQIKFISKNWERYNRLPKIITVKK